MAVGKRINAVSDLNQTISGTYTQAEVQAISDKIDALLQELRDSHLMDRG